MAKTSNIEPKLIVRDAYTERLLDVCYELVKKNAIRNKTEFTEAIGISLSFLNQIEVRKANYPKRDAGRIALAEKNLTQRYGVNALYLQGLSDVKFTREPEQVKQATGAGTVLLNFRDKRQKQQLLAEIEEKDRRIADLEARLAQLGLTAEQVTSYTKSDNKPDKAKKK